MKPTVPPEPRCELCGLKRSAPRHRNGDMQSFHRFEEPEAAAVPPEPAPPTARKCPPNPGSHATWCSDACWVASRHVEPAAAPPTVAPARLVAHNTILAEWGELRCEDLDHLTSCEIATKAIERDRASRSPGPAWKPCFVCGEKVEVPDIEVDQDGAALVPVCGPCRRRPLSGLDAATVEACAREAEAYDAAPLSERHVTTAARIRALATPPGQAKP